MVQLPLPLELQGECKLGLARDNVWWNVLQQPCGVEHCLLLPCTDIIFLLAHMSLNSI